MLAFYSTFIRLRFDLDLYKLRKPKLKPWKPLRFQIRFGSSACFVCIRFDFGLEFKSLLTHNSTNKIILNPTKTYQLYPFAVPYHINTLKSVPNLVHLNFLHAKSPTNKHSINKCIEQMSTY